MCILFRQFLINRSIIFQVNLNFISWYLLPLTPARLEPIVFN